MRRMMLMVMTVSLAACAGRGSVYNGRTGPEAVMALYDRIDMHGDTPAAVERSLGEPVRVDRDTVANRHGYGIDTAIVVRHDHWRHEFLALGASDRVLLTGVESTDPSVSFPAGIRIGEITAEVARSRLGVPESQESVADTSVLRWRNPAMEADSYVELHVVRDTVRLVRWVPYVD